MSHTWVFLGPSLPVGDAVRILGDAAYLPPVAVGDVYRLVREARPRRVVIIDGYFERMAAVWHKELLWALEQGVATAADIDRGMQLGCGHPMGPLTLLDFVGLDTTYFIANIMFDEFRETRFAPPPLLKRMVLAGHLGKKSGKGFYDYQRT